MADIFLSYSQEDRLRVAPIVRALEATNWTVWWDARGRAGVDIDEMVDKELAEAKCILVVWSSRSVDSDWVIGEADEGRSRKILIPVAIDKVQPPRRFRQLNTVSLTTWAGDVEAEEFQQVIEGVKFHVWSGLEDSDSPQAKGYEIAVERLYSGIDRVSAKYFSILNTDDPIYALESVFGWRIGCNDYGPIKYYYVYISHPDVANSKRLSIIRTFELKTLKKDYPDSWQDHIDHLQPVLVLDYSYFQLLEDKEAAVGGMLYLSRSKPIQFYAPFGEWSARLRRLLE